jgi:hypothetical protein
MRPFVRVIGKVLRLVGVSSPEESAAKASNPLSSTFLTHTETTTCKAVKLRCELGT